jgi:hypothetical protein
MYESNGSIWLFAISVLMLVAVLAFSILTGFVPYGSPAEVLGTFYSACNSGDFTLAGKLLEPQANRVLTLHIGAVEGGLPEICDTETKHGHLRSVEFLHQEIRGDVGHVRYRLYYEDGSTIEDSQGVVTKHWVWKITP